MYSDNVILYFLLVLQKDRQTDSHTERQKETNKFSPKIMVPQWLDGDFVGINAAASMWRRWQQVASVAAAASAAAPAAAADEEIGGTADASISGVDVDVKRIVAPMESRTVEIVVTFHLWDIVSIFYD